MQCIAEYNGDIITGKFQKSLQLISFYLNIYHARHKKLTYITFCFFFFITNLYHVHTTDNIRTLMQTYSAPFYNYEFIIVVCQKRILLLIQTVLFEVRWFSRWKIFPNFFFFFFENFNIGNSLVRSSYQIIHKNR